MIASPFRSCAATGLALGLMLAPPACARQETSAKAGDSSRQEGAQAPASQPSGGAAAESASTSTKPKGDSILMKAADAFIAEKKIDTKRPGWKTSLPKPPVFPFDKDAEVYWNLKTNKGDIKVHFLPDVAPMHVSSMVYLTRLGFYDGLTFHRVITDFMAQGGCPLGNGTGGPGYEFAGEFDPKVRHDRPGLLSMANRGPGTDGSQFFLTFVPTPWLDGKHTIFGEVVDGMDTLKTLESFGSPRGATREKLVIEKASVSVE